MFDIVLEFIIGMVLGIEHFSYTEEEDDEIDRVITLHLLLLRISFIKYRDSECNPAYQG